MKKISEKKRNILKLQEHSALLKASRWGDECKSLSMIMDSTADSIEPVTEKLVSILESVNTTFLDVQVSEEEAENKTRISKLINVLTASAKLLIEDEALSKMIVGAGRKLRRQPSRPSKGGWTDQGNIGGYGGYQGNMGSGYGGYEGNMGSGYQGNMGSGYQGNMGSGYEGNMGGVEGYMGGGPQGNNGKGPQGNNEKGPQGNNENRPQGNNGNRPQGNNGNRTQGNMGGGPQGNMGGGLQGNNGNRPQGNMGGGPQGNMGGGPQGNNGNRTQVNMGGGLQGNNGNRPQGNMGGGSQGNNGNRPQGNNGNRPQGNMGGGQQGNMGGGPQANMGNGPLGNMGGAPQGGMGGPDINIFTTTVQSIEFGGQGINFNPGAINNISIDDIPLEALVDPENIGEMSESTIDSFLDQLSSLGSIASSFDFGSSFNDANMNWSRKKRNAENDDDEEEDEDKDDVEYDEEYEDEKNYKDGKANKTNKRQSGGKNKKGNNKEMSIQGTLQMMMMMGEDKRAPAIVKDISLFMREMIFTPDDESTSRIGSMIPDKLKGEMREVVMMLLKEEMPLEVLSLEAKMISKMGKSLMKIMHSMLPIAKDDVKDIFDKTSKVITNKTNSEEDPEKRKVWELVSKIYETSVNNDEVKSNLEEVLKRVQGRSLIIFNRL